MYKIHYLLAFANRLKLYYIYIYIYIYKSLLIKNFDILFPYINKFV